MPYINEFTSSLVLPSYITTDYSTDLQSQLLIKKQADYDNVISKMNNLRSQSLNITMLNNKGQQKLDLYNKEINDFFSQDLGDVTLPENQQRIAKVFSRISTDTDLKQRSQMSRWYKGQLDSIEKMRNDKDPTKSGYDPINEFVFKNWTGGLTDFMQADDIERFSTERQGYVPFKDLKQKLVNLTKLLHAEEKTTASVEGGRIVTNTNKGVDPTRIRQLLQENLTQDEISQMDILSKYRILTQNNPAGNQSLYSSYSNWLDRETQNTNRDLKIAQANAEEYNPSKVDKLFPKLQGEEKERKIAEYTAENAKWKAIAEGLALKTPQQAQAKLSADEWGKFSIDEKLPYVRQLMFEEHINSISDALSWKDEVQKVQSDTAYWQALRLNQMQDALDWKKHVDSTKLKLQQMKATKGTEGPSEGAYQLSAPENLIGDFEALTDQIKVFATNTTNLINSKEPDGSYTISEKDLNDPSFIEKNASNAYVRLWNQHKNQNPNATRETFQAFVTSVEQGNYNSDPTISSIWADRENQTFMLETMKESSDKVMDIVNKTASPFDVKVGDNSLRDYATKDTKTSSNPSFMVGDEKTGYRKMTWEEVKEDFKKTLKGSEEERVVPIPIMGGDLSPLIVDVAPNKKGNYQSTVAKDLGFFWVVSEAIKKEESNSKAIQDAWSKNMPDWTQGVSVTINDEAVIRTEYAPRISQTIRATTGDDFSFGPEDIVSVKIPKDFGNKGGFLISEKAAKNIQENNGTREFRTTTGTIKGAEITPNTLLAFDYVNPSGYDPLLNKMFESKGRLEKKMPNGYKYSIVNDKIEPIVHITITDPNGVSKSRTVPKGVDIEQTRLLIEGSINSQVK